MNYDPKLAEELRELAKVKERIGQGDEAKLMMRLAAMADKPCPPSLKERLGRVGSSVPHYNHIIVGRNESWLNSLYLGWVLVLWWTPTSLFQIIGPAVIQIIGGLAGGVTGIVAWAIAQIMLVIAAPLGMVRRGQLDEIAGGDDISAA